MVSKRLEVANSEHFEDTARFNHSDNCYKFSKTNDIPHMSRKNGNSYQPHILNVEVGSSPCVIFIQIVLHYDNNQYQQLVYVASRLVPTNDTNEFTFHRSQATTAPSDKEVQVELLGLSVVMCLQSA